MRSIIKPVNRPGCFGSMYERGEEYMASHCMGCRAFNECSGIGGGVETIKASILVPAEPARDIEYAVRW